MEPQDEQCSKPVIPSGWLIVHRDSPIGFCKNLQSIAGWWCNFTILKNDGVRQWEG